MSLSTNAPSFKKHVEVEALGKAISKGLFRWSGDWGLVLLRHVKFRLQERNRPKRKKEYIYVYILDQDRGMRLNPAGLFI